MNLADDAQVIEREWKSLSEVFEICEDYHGFYDETLTDIIENTISDMLTVTNLQKLHPDKEDSSSLALSNISNPIALLNIALRKSLQKPIEYRKWEQEVIKNFTTADFDQVTNI